MKEFKWKEGPSHAAIRKAMSGNEFGYIGDNVNGKPVRKDDIAGSLYFGHYHCCDGRRFFVANEYTQPSVVERVKEKLAAVGVDVVSESRRSITRIFYRLRFVGYTPEIEAALAAEDKAKDDARRAFLAKQNESETESKEVVKSQKIGNAGNITIEDYSERAIAVFGETKLYAEELKNLGGKFNRNLRGRAGWIFSKKRENAVREALKA